MWLFLSVLLLLLPHLVETVPACQDTIKYCQNCSPGFDCKIENSLAGIPFSQQEATCLQILQNDANLYAVAYDPSQVDKCFTYSCEQSESITYSTGYVTYMRTCNTGYKHLFIILVIWLCTQKSSIWKYVSERNKVFLKLNILVLLFTLLFY